MGAGYQIVLVLIWGVLLPCGQPPGPFDRRFKHQIPNITEATNSEPQTPGKSQVRRLWMLPEGGYGACVAGGGNVIGDESPKRATRIWLCHTPAANLSTRATCCRSLWGAGRANVSFP